MNASRGGRRRLVLTLVVSALVALAGCGALEGQDGTGPENTPALSTGPSPWIGPKLSSP